MPRYRVTQSFSGVLSDEVKADTPEEAESIMESSSLEELDTTPEDVLEYCEWKHPTAELIEEDEKEMRTERGDNMDCISWEEALERIRFEPEYKLFCPDCLSKLILIADKGHYYCPNPMCLNNSKYSLLGYKENQ